MLGHSYTKSARKRMGRASGSARMTMRCEALESRQLLSRGVGPEVFGGMGLGGRPISLKAQLGSFAGGGAGAMFGSGNLGLGGGARNPLFLLTASLLNSRGGNPTP